MLGKFDNNGPTSYINRAGSDHTYFDLGKDGWSQAESLVDGNMDEMWKINQKFIENQKNLGKEFFFSHDPQFATGYYLREVNYLTKPISQGGLGGNVVNQGNSLWKVVW